MEKDVIAKVEPGGGSTIPYVPVTTTYGNYIDRLNISGTTYGVIGDYYRYVMEFELDYNENADKDFVSAVKVFDKTTGQTTTYTENNFGDLPRIIRYEAPKYGIVLIDPYSFGINEYLYLMYRQGEYLVFNSSYYQWIVGAQNDDAFYIMCRPSVNSLSYANVDGNTHTLNIKTYNHIMTVFDYDTYGTDYFIPTQWARNIS